MAPIPPPGMPPMGMPGMPPRGPPVGLMGAGRGGYFFELNFIKLNIKYFLFMS